MPNDWLTVFRTCQSWFCHHEWMTCRQRGRVWLRCLHCEKTSQGMSIGLTSGERHAHLERPRRWTSDTVAATNDN